METGMEWTWTQIIIKIDDNIIMEVLNASHTHQPEIGAKAELIDFVFEKWIPSNSDHNLKESKFKLVSLLSILG